MKIHLEKGESIENQSQIGLHLPDEDLLCYNHNLDLISNFITLPPTDKINIY